MIPIFVYDYTPHSVISDSECITSSKHKHCIHVDVTRPTHDT